MFEPEAPNRRREIVADLFLLGVESNALPNYLFRFAVCAPDGKRAFEAYGEDAFAFEFAGA